jgi:hypothetical protein
VDELVTVGVIGRTGELTQRDAEIARMAMEMAKYSIQPRHLRGIMAAVDREAALFKQVVNPELRSGDEGRRREAVNKARHLASVDSRMKELMMANVIDTFAPRDAQPASGHPAPSAEIERYIRWSRTSRNLASR